MYAIVETGGKQYRVTAGDVVEVERLATPVGEEIVLTRVLAVVDGPKVSVGTPGVDGARVAATVLAHGRGRKVRGLKYKAKVNYRKRYGHRQPFTRIRIESIGG